MKKDNKGRGADGDKLPAKSPPAKKELFPKKAEKYLREGGKIEDYPEDNSKNKKKKKLPG
jgi:hypothetical protein